MHSALFDQVRTCDNHCEFCFIYQLPPGLRRSLYVKDDDYRLSFLYGNYTTLTRFTEADLERVITERLSPAEREHPRHRPRRCGRGCCATDAAPRACAGCVRCSTHGITVHGQVVVCPGVNDGAVLDDTLAGVLDRYPELASLCVVPLGVSRWSTEPRMRSHTADEARAVVDTVERLAGRCSSVVLGRRVAFLADEYYLLADRPFPEADAYEGFPMHEDGIGMARTFELEMHGLVDEATGVAAGLLRVGRRRARPRATARRGSCRRRAPSLCCRGETRRSRILTGEYGARVLTPLVDELGRDDVRVVPVRNEFFGGNIGVTGLLVGSDLARVLARRAARPPLPAARRVPARRASSSTARRPPICRARSRSSRPTASRCAPPWASGRSAGMSASTSLPSSPSSDGRTSASRRS